MRQFELYIHGVPVGHDVCGSDKDLEYINSFYNHDDNISKVYLRSRFPHSFIFPTLD